MKNIFLFILFTFIFAWEGQAAEDNRPQNKCAQAFKVSKKIEDSKDQYKFALQHHQGQGAPQDYEQAAYWYKKSAVQGYAEAQVNLAWLHDKGQGVPQDYEQVIYWFEQAANQGHALAQFMLGSISIQFKGDSKDLKQSFTWFEKAANQGHAESQFIIGKMLLAGKGIPQNYIMAHAWFNLAAYNNVESASTYRDIVAKKLNSNQVVQAQKIAGKMATGIKHKQMILKHRTKKGYRAKTLTLKNSNKPKDTPQKSTAEILIFLK